jgi:hypothetical protein
VIFLWSRAISELDPEPPARSRRTAPSPRGGFFITHTRRGAIPPLTPTAGRYEYAGRSGCYP